MGANKQRQPIVRDALCQSQYTFVFLRNNLGISVKKSARYPYKRPTCVPTKEAYASVKEPYIAGKHQSAEQIEGGWDRGVWLSNLKIHTLMYAHGGWQGGAGLPWAGECRGVHGGGGIFVGNEE